jgi:hypothetical protein
MPTPTIKRLLTGGNTIRHINSSYVEQSVSGSNPITFPIGAQAGDLLAVLWHNASTPATSAPTVPSGTRSFSQVFLSQTVGSWNLSAHYIELTAADIVTGTFTPGGNAQSNAGYVMSIYRGPKALSTTYVGVVGGAASSTLGLTALALGGSPNRPTAGVLAIVGNQVLATCPTSQPGWTNRLANVGSVYLKFSTFDIPPNGYPGGTVTFSPFGTVSGQPYGVLLEMQF